MANKRVIYSCHSIAIASEGTTTFTAVHGVQSFGDDVNFSIENLYEFGKLAIYHNIEALPEASLTIDRFLDGHPLAYHLATSGATDSSIIGRSNKRCNLIYNIYNDTQQAASGTQVAQVYYSGLYVSSLNYTFQTDGQFKENIGLVGNNKKWILNTANPSGTPYAVVGGFTPTDSPLAAEGVNYRPDFDLVNTRLPKQIPGVNSSTGVINEVGSDGLLKVVLQTVNVSCSFSRDNILQLGKKGPYFRFISFPVEVTCEIGILSREGDSINADENSETNTQDETITILTAEGTKISLGSYCRLRSVSGSGGDAGSSNSNRQITYNYFTQNDLNVQHAADVTVPLRP